MKQKYSPDILNCLANLSSDEVFTSPELANRMLDLLPQELFQSPKTRFLDPCSKSGVFLREITKRLLVGLEGQIPDLQERIDHVMTQQVFGIACTDLTAEMSRRTLYCSKQANGEYSVSTAFHDVQGNLLYERCHHTWNAQGRCEYCGASKGEYLRTENRETYAYPFIHKSIKEIFHKDMQFDVIIGNPPYQLDDGGYGASARPIYPNFVQQAKTVNPRYICMIIPARWYAGGKELNGFRDEMLKDNRIRIIYDIPNASDCFPGVEIKGGVCIFLWNKDKKGDVTVNTIRENEKVSSMTRKLLEKGCDTFIRQNEAISILHKVQTHKEKPYSTIIHPAMTFGLRSFVKDFERDSPAKGYTKVYAQRTTGYIRTTEITSGREYINEWKIIVPEAIGSGEMGKDVVKPILCEPNTINTETYIMNGPFKSEDEAKNAITYIKTKFFHFMLGLKKITQHTTQKVYELIPLQDFSHPWTNEMLYKKYGLDKDEIAFIESMIRPME